MENISHVGWSTFCVILELETERMEWNLVAYIVLKVCFRNETGLVMVIQIRATINFTISIIC